MSTNESENKLLWKIRELQDQIFDLTRDKLILETELKSIQDAIDSFYHPDPYQGFRKQKATIFELLHNYISCIERDRKVRSDSKKLPALEKAIQELSESNEKSQKSNRLLKRKVRILRKIIRDNLNIEMPGDLDLYSFNSRKEFEEFIRKYVHPKEISNPSKEVNYDYEYRYQSTDQRCP